MGRTNLREIIQSMFDDDKLMFWQRWHSAIAKKNNKQGKIAKAVIDGALNKSVIPEVWINKPIGFTPKSPKRK